MFITYRTQLSDANYVVDQSLPILVTNPAGLPWYLTIKRSLEHNLWSILNITAHLIKFDNKKYRQFKELKNVLQMVMN